MGVNKAKGEGRGAQTLAQDEPNREKDGFLNRKVGLSFIDYPIFILNYGGKIKLLVRRGGREDGGAMEV